ncbi:PP2C family protein-serine/threonine phosphatase [Streptomyces sclerotialus]|uniref:PP2C family protein-serine/threonine phosphatase n=1 Tax=Streptomyces sclerotialus TaxID=1957 RepID=UPI0004CA2EEE
METFKGAAAGHHGVGLGTAWGAAPYPVLVADTAGALLEPNRAAALLFPDAVPGAWLHEVVPSWLADAHRRLTDPRLAGGPEAVRSAHREGALPVRGKAGGRSFEAYATFGAEGEVVWWLIDDTDRRLAEEALKTERERALLLSEVSNALLASMNVERCMTLTAQLAARHLADAAVVIPSMAGGSLSMITSSADGAVTRRAISADPDQVPGLSEALQGLPSVSGCWIDPAAVPEWMVPGSFAGPVGSVVVTPLPGHGVPTGALVLLRREDRTAFSESEEAFARLFAGRAGAAWSVVKLYAEQASITATLMRELLPPTLRQVHGVEFAGGYRPSGQGTRVGGDFYDVHPGSDARQETFVVLGDVCGKGLDAAVLTGKIRNTLQALLPMADDHHRVLSLLNGALVNSHHTRFATLVLASALRVEGRVRLRLTCAGHPAPLIVRTDGTVEEAETYGTLVGVLPEIEAETAVVELAPGETCLMFTDGITEAKGGPLGGDMFGERRLRNALSECVAMPAEAVVERIQMLATQWIGQGRHDDMAVVAITAPRTARSSAADAHISGR